MIQARLNDAAIALCEILEAANIKQGIFGGYAIGCLGGPRESKDIDCLAAISKPEIVALLHGSDGFAAVPQTREDYVAFLWSEEAHVRSVLVEVFVSDFKGAGFGMDSVVPMKHQVTGQIFGTRTINLLSPFLIFKGKVFAAARRAKFLDSADLRWLENNAGPVIQQEAHHLPLEEVGLAMKRYSILDRVFLRLGINVEAARARTAALDLKELPSYQKGDVQASLLAPSRP